MKPAVSVLDADAGQRRALETLLGDRGYRPAGFADPAAFFESFESGVPAAAFVSMDLPGMDGREVLRVLRSNKETRRVALIAVSRGRRRREEVVAGFEAGADEFFEPPFDAELVAARLVSLLRRGAEDEPSRRVELGRLAVDLDGRTVRLAGKAVRLTRLEFDLLAYMLRQRGRILTRGNIQAAVWGPKAAVSRTVDKHVEALRRKLPALSDSLETVVNVGYLLR